MPTIDTGCVARPNRLAATVLVGVVLLGACTSGNASKPANHTATTSAHTPTSTAILGSSDRNTPPAPFHPVGAQVSEVSHLRKFLAAYNAGQLNAALAQFSDNQALGFSDCDYQTQQVIEGHGRAELSRWLQTNIAHHDRLIGAGVFSANADQPVLGVSFLRRSSDVLTRAGHPDGITPTLGAKVKFDPTGLITEFNNGPAGGSADACHIR